MPSPLIQRLYREFQYPMLDAASLPAFLQAHEYSVLFFTEDPKRFPETSDVAVVLPELVKAFGHRFQAAVIAQTDEKRLQSVYGFQSYPALVFMKHDHQLGVLTGIKDWSEYLEEIPAILAATPKRPSALGAIPVVSQ